MLTSSSAVIGKVCRQPMNGPRSSGGFLQFPPTIMDAYRVKNESAAYMFMLPVCTVTNKYLIIYKDSRTRSHRRGHHRHGLTERHSPNSRSKRRRNGSYYRDQDSSSSNGSRHNIRDINTSDYSGSRRRSPRQFSEVAQNHNGNVAAPTQIHGKAENSTLLPPSAIGEATYQKYLKLKERQQRLRLLRADLEDEGTIPDPPLVSYPRPRDNSSETRSLASAGSYAQGKSKRVEVQTFLCGSQVKSDMEAAPLLFETYPWGCSLSLISVCFCVII